MSSMQLSLLPSRQTHPRQSYHSRRPLPGPAVEASAEIKRGEKKARQQEEAILAFFRANPGAWSPSQVWQRVGPREMAKWIERDAEGVACRIHIDPMADGGPRWLLTSVRRSITTLTTKGLLRMTMERRLGPFGAKEFLWELTEEGKK